MKVYTWDEASQGVHAYTAPDSLRRINNHVTALLVDAHLACTTGWEPISLGQIEVIDGVVRYSGCYGQNKYLCHLYFMDAPDADEFKAYKLATDECANAVDGHVPASNAIPVTAWLGDTGPRTRGNIKLVLEFCDVTVNDVENLAKALMAFNKDSTTIRTPLINSYAIQPSERL